MISPEVILFLSEILTGAAVQANISLDQLEALINNFCIPKHSHTITKQSIFYTDIFSGSVFTEADKFYYHPSLIKLAMKANQYSSVSSYSDVANKMKADFIHELH